MGGAHEPCARWFSLRPRRAYPWPFERAAMLRQKSVSDIGTKAFRTSGILVVRWWS